METETRELQQRRSSAQSSRTSLVAGEQLHWPAGRPARRKESDRVVQLGSARPWRPFSEVWTSPGRQLRVSEKTNDIVRATWKLVALSFLNECTWRG